MTPSEPRRSLRSTAGSRSLLKPSMRVAANRFTRAKAWRADDKAMLLRLYAEAARLVGDEGVVIQDLIPGGGACQLSYAAYWADGMPVGELTARRTRQYPVDFGYTSTLVETIEDPALIAASRRLLAGIGFAGLVEVEYKRDAREAVSPSSTSIRVPGRGSGSAPRRASISVRSVSVSGRAARRRGRRAG